MAPSAVRAVWAEPRVPDPPAPAARDWVLVAVFASAAIVESVLRRDLPWSPVSAAVTVVLAFTLPWRRTRPLAMLTLAFGVSAAVYVASLVGHAGGPIALASMVYMLLLVYAVFRWGSGRETVVGSVIVLATYGMGTVTVPAPIGDVVFGLVVLVLPAVLGASARVRATSRQRELDQVRLREREQLARELHDTVAHHVSAMVIRAQAGRVVARSQPGAAVEALEIIEEEGSRTLAEMRTMVGALRERGDADLAPQSGAADVARLARSGGDGPAVEVHLSGDLEGLSASVGAATYRIAQESITNAVRHARNATRIVVLVTGERDSVRLSVRDDGDSTSGSRPRDGYGVVGMTERATLLGGTLQAGPGPDRGWVVDAVLPRVGPTA